MLESERREIVEHAMDLSALTPGRTGNISRGRGEHIAISPTGIDYGAFELPHIPVITMDGEQVDGRLKPSSEQELHLRLYSAFDCGAIVHTHSPWATTLAVLREPLPPVHYIIGLAGVCVPIAEYATFGTSELGDNAVRAMEAAGSSACLLANHGLVVTGETIDETLEVARSIEAVAKVYCLACSMGEPVELPAEEMEDVIAKFAAYGQ